MSELRTPFWWDRSDRPAQLEAVIFSVDAVLAHPRADERLFADAVWNLHCAGIRVVAITAAHWPDVRRPLRELLGDGAVEVLVTGDDVSRPKPHPEVYRLALWQLGIRAADAVAVEDSVAGLRAALAAGLTTVVVTDRVADYSGATAVLTSAQAVEHLSVQGCRRMLDDSHRLSA
jgi:beta-phosphoglucomutase-like phosphatase (HAD superfamily)